MTLQQELARTERHRLVHARAHGCEGDCNDGRYLEGCAHVIQRLVDENQARRPVVATGSLGDVRSKLCKALARDELARKDELVFALLAYEVLEPGEVALLDRFDEEDSVGAVAWIREVLAAAGAEFMFDA